MEENREKILFNNKQNMTTNCIEFLRGTYYNVINVPDEGSPSSQPYPVFFPTNPSSNQCDASLYWPNTYNDIAQFVIQGTFFDLNTVAGNSLNFDSLSDFYVPEGITITVKSGAKTPSPPNTVSYSGPTLQIDLTIFKTPQIQIALNPDYNDLLMNMCMGTIMTIEGKPLTVYDINNAVGYANCDAIMSKLCALTSLNVSKPACACFSDQMELDIDYPDLNPSVICFGSNCALEGYRTQTMIEQECSVAICEQFVEQHGQDISITGKTHIYCDNSIYTLPSPHPNATVSQTPAPTGETTTTTVSIYVWVLVAAAVLLFILTLGALFWKRSQAK